MDHREKYISGIVILNSYKLLNGQPGVNAKLVNTNNQLDIYSDTYFNNGCNNFSATIKETQTL